MPVLSDQGTAILEQSCLSSIGYAGLTPKSENVESSARVLDEDTMPVDID